MRDAFKGLFVLILLIMSCGVAGYMENNYSMDAIVLEKNDNILVLLDTENNLWEYETSAFTVGDKVKVYYNNNTTDFDRTDDIIKKIKKI